MHCHCDLSRCNGWFYNTVKYFFFISLTTLLRSEVDNREGSKERNDDVGQTSSAQQSRIQKRLMRRKK